MTDKKREGSGNFTDICPNPNGTPYSLWGLIAELKKNSGFAADFVDLLKQANNNNKGAIECLDGYLAPTTDELDGLGISASDLEAMKRCTESGSLVAAIAKQAAGQAPPR